MRREPRMLDTRLLGLSPSQTASLGELPVQSVRPYTKPGLFMNTYYVVRSSRPTGLFSFRLLDGLHVRLRRPYLREAPAGFGLERLATAFMNYPG